MKKRRRWVLTVIGFVLLLWSSTVFLPACSQSDVQTAPISEITPGEESSSSTEEASETDTETSRVPPDEINVDSEQAGLNFEPPSPETILDTVSSLSTVDVITIIVMGVFVFIAVVFGRRIATNILRRLAKRTKNTFDDELVDRIAGQVRWLVVVISLNFATDQLSFLSGSTQKTLADIYFFLYYGITFTALYTTLTVFFGWYADNLDDDKDTRVSKVFLPILRRTSIVLLIVLAIVVFLDHIGINITGLAAALGLAGLAISLAAQDTIADAISGYVILIDQPFRVGDRIEIPDQNTWGDVTEVGTRTTKIRTRDNTMVIMPNSTMVSNQVLNYSYPDPTYRIQTDVGIAYGSDINQVKEALGEAVQNVSGVLRNKPVDILFNEFGDSSMTFRVRWWLSSYADKREMYDKVHTAIQNALDTAKIESPFPTQKLNIQMLPDEVEASRDND